jgi:hypothetical protein
MTNLSFQAKFKGLILGSFVVVLIYLAGCDITDPTDGIKAILNTKERTTTVSVIFRDSNTGEPVGFSDGTVVNVELTGPDSDKAIDLLNRSKSTFKSAKGFLSFALLDEITPGETNSLQFTIVARANGYITTSKPVTINAPRGNPIEINMVNTNNLPTGVMGESNQNIGSAVNGRTTAPIMFQTQRGTVTNTRASFEIQDNTLVTDANGQQLQGQLRSNFHLFNSRDVESLQSFPGGFSVQAEGAPNGNDRVVFTTGGFTSVEIFDESGRRARNFDPPIQVTIELDSQVRDHENNQVNAGDEVPIWSYDDEEGTWTFEGNAPITNGANGNLEVNFDASHLSWWNIDWFGNACYMGVKVNLLNNNSQLRGKLLRADNGNFLGWMASRTLPSQPNFIQFLWAPQDIAGVLELYNMNDDLLETVQLPDLCSTTPVDVNLGVSSEVTVTFRGVGICPDKDDIEIRPSFPAFYKPAVGGQWLSAGTVVNGELEITLPSPNNYLFGAYYEDDWYEYELDLTSAQDGDIFEEEVELPEDVCADL